MKETIKAIINRKDLGHSAKILWLKLFCKYEYTEFSGSYDEMSSEIDVKRNTVRTHVWQLININAMIVKPYYETGHRGRMGQTFQLIDPAKWNEGK